MTAEELISKYLEVRGPRETRGRTLSQKQGARKGGRTQSQKLKLPKLGEAGFLQYYYYRPHTDVRRTDS